MIQQSQLLGVYIQKMNLVTQRYWTPMFIVAIITIVRIWKQSKQSYKDEWIKKMPNTHSHTHLYTHAVEYSVQFSCSTLKKKEILPLVTDGCTWRTLYWGKYAWHRETSIAWSHLCVEWNSHTGEENRMMIFMGWEVGEIGKSW